MLDFSGRTPCRPIAMDNRIEQTFLDALKAACDTPAMACAYYREPTRLASGLDE
jgi:hypothetical protein